MTLAEWEHTGGLPDSGLRIYNYSPSPITEYERREAARFGGVPYLTFCDLPYEERVTLLAYRRVHQLIDAVMEHKAQQKANHHPVTT